MHFPGKISTYVAAEGKSLRVECSYIVMEYLTSEYEEMGTTKGKGTSLPE